MKYIGAIALLILFIAGHPILANLQNAQAHKFDEFILDIFSPPDTDAVQARLVRFAKQLKSRPGSRAYIITYGERLGRNCLGEANSRALGAKYAIRDLGIKEDRILTVDGGYREQAATELWIVPGGAPNPSPTPTVRATDVACCPYITLEVQPFVASIKKPLRFTAEVFSYDKKVSPTYSWTVSSGKIIDGQGTNSISVEPDTPPKNVVATVEIGGHQPECPNRATLNAVVGSRHFKLIESPRLACEELGAVLSSMSQALRDEPAFQGHIIVYGGRHGKYKDADIYAAFVKEFLVEGFGVEPGRLQVIDGGYREELTLELWLSHRGEQAPPLKATVDNRFVRLQGRARRPECAQ